MQIDLGTTATMRQMEEVRAALLVAIENGEDIAIDASAIEEADLSLVQLLEAARAHRASMPGSGRDGEAEALRLTAPANPVVAALLERAGLLTRADTATCRFWFHREFAR